MATPFAFTQRFPQPPDEAFTMFMDPVFVEAKCSSTGSTRTSVDVVGDGPDTVTITSMRVLPADVPAIAKSFVGETIEVTEVQTWQAPAADGARQGTVKVTFSGPLTFQGTLTLAVDGGGSTVRTEGTFKAKVPFVGGQIEEVAATQTARYLTAEEAIGAAWASR